MNILGIDFGKAKVGLASADSETRIAFVYGTLKNDKDLLKKIREIVEKEGIGKIIVGLTKIDSIQGKKFGDSLKEKLGVKVEFQEEMFSTQLAERNLKEKNIKKIKRFDDQEAARIILQSWLDKQE